MRILTKRDDNPPSSSRLRGPAMSSHRDSALRAQIEESLQPSPGGPQTEETWHEPTITHTTSTSPRKYLNPYTEVIHPESTSFEEEELNTTRLSAQPPPSHLSSSSSSINISEGSSLTLQEEDLDLTQPNEEIGSSTPRSSTTVPAESEIPVFISTSIPAPTSSSLSSRPPRASSTSFPASLPPASLSLPSSSLTSPPSLPPVLPLASSSLFASPSLSQIPFLKPTPLHQAVESGNLQLVKQLLQENSNLNIEAKSTNGNTPLHLAAYFGHTEVARILVKAGNAKLEAKNFFGETPLHLAASFGSTETLVALVQMGAKKEEKDESGGTPMHSAARVGDCEAVRMMVYLGFNQKAKNNKGKTPLQVAESKGNNEVAETLRNISVEEPKKSVFDYFNFVGKKE